MVSQFMQFLQFDSAHGLARKPHIPAIKAVGARLQELKTDAKSEGHPLSTESEKELLTFLEALIFSRRPFISLLDNGNLRAVWKNAEGEQIALQFRGGGEIQFVLFAQRPGTNIIARSSGRDTLSDIGRQIDALNLRRLMTT